MDNVSFIKCKVSASNKHTRDNVCKHFPKSVANPISIMTNKLIIRKCIVLAIGFHSTLKNCDRSTAIRVLAALLLCVSMTRIMTGVNLLVDCENNDFIWGFVRLGQCVLTCLYITRKCGLVRVGYIYFVRHCALVSLSDTVH